jgi:ferric-dicitrate binding protein FerR (iron transport regulator)
MPADREAVLALWQRLLAGETLSDEEERLFHGALGADEGLRREVLDDEALHGYFRAAGRSAGDGEAFAKMFVDLLDRQRSGRPFADRVSRNIRHAMERRRRRTGPAWAAAAAVLLAAVGIVILNRPVPVLARLETAKSGVAVLRGGAEVPALDLQRGDEVRVPPGGSAVIRYPDGSLLAAGPGSRVALEAGAQGAKRAVLRQGALTAHVVPQLGGRSMAFSTPHAEATVMGTTLSVSIMGGATRLDVAKGRVRVVQKNTGKSVDVVSGQFALVPESAPPVVQSLIGIPAPPAGTDEPPGGFVDVQVGATIGRTWEQVKADRYAYGPKQAYDAATGETLVYLPYGNNARLYSRVRGLLYDPRPGMPAKFHSQDSETGALLTFELRFDRPVGSFRLTDGWTEIELAADTVAGTEYSVDGKNWVTIREVRGADRLSRVLEPFVENFKAAGLDTQALFIRYYTRNPASPEESGAGRWLQMWLAGDPSWGDAATSFFNRQIQVRIAPVRAPGPMKER